MPSTARKTDPDLQQDVLCELAWDARVPPMEVAVLARNGVVTLVGTVESWAQAHAAEQAAHRVGGVLDVANDLIVKLPDDARRSDTEIAGAVRRALERDVRVPAARLQSTVSAGVITLEGSVSNLQQRRDAEAAIAHLFGVRRVLNHIEIEAPAAKRAS